MSRTGVYLDHAASSTLRDSARDALLGVLDLGPANASGSHAAARRARALVEDARDALAGVVGCDPGEIVFTSGGTEGDNLAIRGVLARTGSERGVGHGAERTAFGICSAIEHPAVLEPFRERGVIECPVDARGVVSLSALRAELATWESGTGGRPALVSVMTVNNEVGSIQPVADIAALVREHAPGVAVHTDAVQALSWLDLRPITAAVDLLTISAHKFGGPHGVGACIVRRSTPLRACQTGGGQERELRSGTLNVGGIVAMAAAAVETDSRRADECTRIGALRDRLVDRITSALGGIRRTGVVDGDAAHLAAGFAHLCVSGVDSEALLFLLDEAGVAASAASACASGAQQRSHVLGAMGVDPADSAGAIRLTLGHSTTDDDVEVAVGAIVAAVERLRTYPR